MTSPTTRWQRRILRVLSCGVALAGLAPLTLCQGRAGDGPGVPSVPPSWVIGNGQLDAAFSSDAGTPGGSSVWLDSLTNVINVPALPPVAMNPGSGGWRLRLVVENSAAASWFEVSMDGTTAASAPGLGTLDALTLDGVTMVAGGFDASWSGALTVAGESSAFSVQTHWRLVPGDAGLDTTLDVDLAAGGGLGFYLSEAVYPTLRVADYGTANDALLLPWLGGSLVSDPTNPAYPFKASLGSGLNFFPCAVSAYYDGEAASRCFAIDCTDSDDYWKELWISVGSSGGTGHVQYELRHVPDDIFDDATYSTPYAVRMGVFEGDWWDLAEHYRKQLAKDTNWYQGPVGSPSQSMPQVMKDRVAEIFLQPGFEGDQMDDLALQMTAVGRVLGPKVNAVFYGGHSPDSMDHWFFGGGYLPGRPSFVGAVRTGQKRADLDQVVSPYVNGTAAGDYTDPALQPPITQPTPLQQQVVASFLLDEDGSPRYFQNLNGAPRAGLLCSGDSWWQSTFPALVRQIADYTGMRGAYLDYFLVGACYSQAHAHPPGGGNWMYATRLQQIRDLKQPPHDQLCLPIEFLYGRLTEEVDGMHHDPARNLLSAVDYPGTTIPKPMENAVTVPFFRTVYDNVKLSRITAETPADSGRRAWIEANNVFTFGQIPGIVRPLAELVPAFSDRFVFAPYYQFLDGLLGGDATTANGGYSSLPNNSDDGIPSSQPPWLPQQKSLNVPYLRFLGDITRVLRDEGFMTWHTGTLVRLPSLDVQLVSPPGFAGVPGVELAVNDTYQTNSPVYMEEYLVPGTYLAPADLPGADAASLAFVCANPWVDPFAAGVFTIDFTLVPGDYPGWSNSESYTVSFYDGQGGSQTLPGLLQGPFDLGALVGPKTLQPGDIVWWVLRKASGG